MSKYERGHGRPVARKQNIPETIEVKIIDKQQKKAKQINKTKHYFDRFVTGLKR